MSEDKQMLFSKTKACSAALALLFSLTTQIGTGIAAEPGKGGVIRTNAEGRIACQTLKAGGGEYWRAKVRGRLAYGDGRFGASNNSYFSINYCFASHTECRRFVSRIDHHIYPVQSIRYAQCTLIG